MLSPVATYLADIAPAPMVGSGEQSVIVVLLIGGALALIGFRLYRKRK